MDSKIIIEAKRQIHELQRMKRMQESRLAEIAHLDSLKINRGYKRNGKYSYSVRRRGETATTYIGVESSEKVRAIKEQRYLKKSLDIIDGDIKLLNALIGKYRDYGYEAVNEMLPKAYRNADIDLRKEGDVRASEWKKSSEESKRTMAVYMPEGLNKRTCDGNYVRSKSEVIIYNYLYNAGVTFVYEKPTMIGSRMYYPDFTLLSEIDFQTEIIIEHQGMMGDSSYSNRYHEKLMKYWNAGYVPGVDVFFTFDSRSGDLDLTPIEDIVDTKIRPQQ